jgi:hypothetical protein
MLYAYTGCGRRRPTTAQHTVRCSAQQPPNLLASITFNVPRINSQSIIFFNAIRKATKVATDVWSVGCSGRLKFLKRRDVILSVHRLRGVGFKEGKNPLQSINGETHMMKFTMNLWALKHTLHQLYETISQS